ncbi:MULTISPECIES: ribosome biogenesis GTPase Der [Peptoniphilus]|uniref:ribosome biogenesis GTPase Der n=1 Tax=Peptoniphilus TaxID=162289 RepID=UPI0008D9F5A7|nr:MULTISPECIES: ribosome biogenesis GTPase Der [Peptoniphilus]MBS6610026.1 ribosome biogenesis GTPase Der [Peptoniphilus harei]MDU1043483.1 ribosome biogenesis GTPase Der [Peptoniphilus rhinitidis]MDU2110567.1 ribosome biogenesis GTPase Der [Peptoniphilus lacydonensis]MDU5376825.1 ribosome biogenesis GTPase Der [Peptoniphilus lacydonensis]MDU5436462.1 ribosome biogenesis GTPase Der [Peptoniphilus lacydonensis]
MEMPIVSIIGRPNVGKSTLFNKIVGRKVSITEDTPGVTRDRIYQKATWLNYKFLLVDTGGLDLKDEDIFMSSIKAQIDMALETSDVVIFLVDGAEGLSPTDREISQFLRKSKTKVVLAVNKYDSKITKENIFDFYELGLGDPVGISAEQGTGVGDLLDEVVKDMIPVDAIEEDDNIRVTLIGKPNVGKSSLLNYLTGEKRSIVTNIPGTTRDSIDSLIKYKDNEYIFVDTAGLRKKKKIVPGVERYSVIRTLTAIERSNVCVLMIDALEGVTEQDSKIVGYAHDNNKAIIIAVNKWDALEKETKTMKNFERDIRIKLPFVPYAPIIFISAKTGQRVNEFLDLIEIVNNNYNHRIQTGVLNDILNRAVLMNQPPSDKGKRGKLYYGSQVSVRPPKFLLFVNDKDLFHFSYIRYIENQIRETYPFDGTPIILDLKNRGSERKDKGPRR